MLLNEDRVLLTQFIERSNPGAPYTRRANILLLADSGSSSESIAVELGLPVVNVRQWLRAFNRNGLQVFPDDLLHPEPPFNSEDPISVSGKIILETLRLRLVALEPELMASADVKSVHESRKTIRKMLTAMNQLAPHYEYIDLKHYRKRFRKVMRQLAHCRDIDVFLYKLQLHIDNGSSTGDLTASSLHNLMELHKYWQKQGRSTRQKVQKYLSEKRYGELLVEFGEILEPDDRDLPSLEHKISPYKTGHLAPVFVFERLASVRAHGETIEGAPVSLFHALRIQLKEFRHTLEFYTPIMGPSLLGAIETIKRLLTHLGDLNDARIHLEMMSDMDRDDLVAAVAEYQRVKRNELQMLVAEFPNLWAEINQQAWRESLSRAVGVA